MRIRVGNTEALSFRSYTLAKLGRAAEAQVCLQQLLESNPPAAPMHLALAHLGLGDCAKAELLLDRGFSEHDVRLVFLSVERRWRDLGEATHGKILKRAGLENLIA